MSTDTATAPPPAPPEAAPPRHSELRDTVVLTALSILLALIVGGVLIAVSDPEVQEAATYFFAQPMDLVRAVFDSVWSAYSALFAGAVFNAQADTIQGAFRPLTETLVFATPLIAAGLAVAIAFKAGLFNIGAEGQIILGATAAAYVGFAWNLPVGIHLVLAVVAGIIGGALWGGIAGVLKARTGAHEVIVTIMLNYIARYLLAFLLTTQAFLRPGSNNPISPPVAGTAEFPLLFGSWSRLHLGLFVVLATAVGVWWLLDRSIIGFRYRAIGANAAAARTAGIDVGRSTTSVMLVAGGLAGLAGVIQVLGTEKSLVGSISGGVGFDAITVALLGRGSPLGVVLAGILFGGLKAGGLTMQARTGTPIDIVLVVQSLIVLFIAAPPLVRAVFRVKNLGGGSMQVSKGWNA